MAEHIWKNPKNIKDGEEVFVLYTNYRGHICGCLANLFDNDMDDSSLIVAEDGGVITTALAYCEIDDSFNKARGRK
jgi:hypothetical protein